MDDGLVEQACPPSPTIIFREERDIFEMPHLGRSVCRLMRDLDHIEAKSLWCRAEPKQISINRSAQNALLAIVDGEVSRHQCTSRSCFDLDEDQNLSVTADEIDLTPPVGRISPVPRDHDEPAISSEPLSSPLLTFSSSVLIGFETEEALNPTKHDLGGATRLFVIAALSRR
jgi:hypothetical protein